MITYFLFLSLFCTLNESASLRDIKGKLKNILGEVKHLTEGLKKDVVPSSSRSDSDVEKRNAVRGSHSIWWSRNIPVEVATNLKDSTWRNFYIALNEIYSKTCIRFVDRAGESNYVRFQEAETTPCDSYVGNLGYYIAREHPVNIGSKCGGGLELHETLHLLGLTHEFTRPDRDTYIKVDNIPSGDENTYAKKLAWQYQTFGVPFDYDSATNYDAGTKITVRNDPDGSLTSRLGVSLTMSTLDAYKLNQLYQCGSESTSNPGYTEWNNWSPCFNQGLCDVPVGSDSPYGYDYWQNQCKRSRQRYCFSSDLSKCTLRPGTFQNEAAKRVVTEVEDCDAGACDAVVDGWSSWSLWGGCTVTCGGGRRYRNRDCASLAPENGEVPCVGDAFEQHPTSCNDFECYQAPINGGCDFESDWCTGYTYDSAWSLGRAVILKQDIGETLDHTRVYKPILGSNGQYAFVKTTDAANGDYTIHTPYFQSVYCMTFWYHMYGNADLQFAVLTRTDTQIAAESYDLILHLTGSQGNEWKQETLTVRGANGEPYIVAFYVYVPADSGIAIDDISFVIGECAGESKRVVGGGHVDDGTDGEPYLMKSLFGKSGDQKNLNKN